MKPGHWWDFENYTLKETKCNNKKSFEISQDVRKTDPLPLDEFQREAQARSNLGKNLSASLPIYSYHTLNYINGFKTGGGIAQASFNYQESLPFPVCGIRLETVVINYAEGITNTNSFFFLEMDIGAASIPNCMDGKPAKAFTLIPAVGTDFNDNVVWENHSEYWLNFTSPYFVRQIVVALKDQNGQYISAANSPWTFIASFSLLHCGTH